jgi:hypothetical protein
MQVIFAGERQPLPEPIPTPNAWRALVPATERELKQLLALVKAKFSIPADDLQAFAVAFAYVCQKGRTDKPNRERQVGYWGAEAEAWARAHYAPQRNVDAMVFPAVKAAGDILYCVRSDCYEAAIGLAEHGGRRADQVLVATDQFGNPVYGKCEPAWKQILAGTRSLREPDQPPPSVVAQPSSIRRQVHYRDAELGDAG